jgi:hypothetical protein
MNARRRRIIASACIWVCLACVVAATVTFYVAPHVYPFRAALMTDQAGTFGVLGGFAFYLRVVRGGTS